MKEHFKSIWQDIIISRSILISFFIEIATIFYIIIIYKRLPPLIPIFIQLAWGNSRLAVTPFIFLPLGIACCFLVGNTIISSYIYNKIPLLARILGITSLLLSLLVAIFSIRLVTIIL